MLRPSLRTLSPFARIAENALGEEEAIAKFVVLTRRSHGHGDGRGEIAFKKASRGQKTGERSRSR